MSAMPIQHSKRVVVVPIKEVVGGISREQYVDKQKNIPVLVFLEIASGRTTSMRDLARFVEPLDSPSRGSCGSVASERCPPCRNGSAAAARSG